MNLALFTGMPGGLEILIILFVILLLFGGRKLPELARSLGKSLSEFRKGREEGEKEVQEAAKLESAESGELEDEQTEKKQ